MDLTLEHAAADLYATPWNAFRRDHAAAAVARHPVPGPMLAFIISFDDFVITAARRRAGADDAAALHLGQITRGDDAGDQRDIAPSCWCVSVLFVVDYRFSLRSRRGS